MSAKAKNKLTPQQRKATLNRVLHKIRPYSAFVVCSLLVAAVSVAAQLYIPILCGDAIDKMLGKGNVDLAGVLRIAVSILVVAAVAALAQWLLSVCNNRITFSVSRDLRNEALRKIQTLPLSYLDSHPSGDIVSRMVADVDTFADGLLMGFTQLFSGILTIFGTLLFMLRENVPITLVVVCITPLSLVVAGFLAKRSYGYFQSQSTVRGKQTALVNEMIEGQKVVQAFGHEAESLAAFDEVNGQLQDVSLKAIFFSSLTNPATRFVNNIVYAGVGLVGALYAVRGGITIGQLSVFLSYANQYTKPFNEISGVVTELQNALACAARVFELLDAEDQVPEAENAAALQPDGHVQLQDVSFRYLPDRPLIEGLSLDVQPGQRIAIVGPTGCGKTTLINLLMRFYDVNSGSIKVSGTDIRDVTRASLRGSYGMVLQDTWLRAGTVRENIAYGKPDATMDEVIAAAKAAHAHSFIRRLPDGYDTVITENGGNISQGQKQLLCIARVMLGGENGELPPMLILDEATSSIDTRTEIKIQSAFARLMNGRTSFIVAHRLSTIQEADVILVMKDGHIIEQGTHEELLKKLSAINVGAGKTFDAALLGEGAAERWTQMLQGLRATLAADGAKYAQKLGQWIYYGKPIGDFGTEYTYRAMVALVGLGANTVDVAIYPKTAVDETGAALTGEKKYTLHFETLPPTLEGGFWSVTAYGEDDFLIDNSIDRYCINDRSDFKLNADGTLDIILSKDAPEDTSNWLPVSDGEFHLFMRIYVPDMTALDSWQPPVIREQ